MPARQMLRTDTLHSAVIPKKNEETLQQEGCARRAAWDLAKKFYTLKKSDEATFWVPIEKEGSAGTPTSTRPEERIRSINAHDKQKKKD